MDKNRLWTLGVGGAIVVVALAGWFLGIAPIAAQASAASVQRDSMALSNSTGQARVTSLRAQYANLGGLRAKLAALTDSVPQTANIPVFLRELNTLTIENNVILGTVTIGDAQTYESAVLAPAPVAATPAATTTTAPVSPVSPDGPSRRLIQIPISISITGTYSNVMDFVRGVQNGTRLYFVSNVNLVGSGDKAEQFTGTITGLIFVLPGVLPTPAATPSPTPAPTSTP